MNLFHYNNTHYQYLISAGLSHALPLLGRKLGKHLLAKAVVGIYTGHIHHLIAKFLFIIHQNPQKGKYGIFDPLCNIM